MNMREQQSAAERHFIPCVIERLAEQGATVLYAGQYSCRVDGKPVPKLGYQVNINGDLAFMSFQDVMELSVQPFQLYQPTEK